MNIRGGGDISNFSLTYNERLINFNRVLQNNSFLNKFKPGGSYVDAYNKYDNKNKEFTDRILRGELVTSTEMNEIIKIPHTLPDGTQSYFTFAESFADYCGWYTASLTLGNKNIISSIDWCGGGGVFPTYITMNDNYLC